MKRTNPRQNIPTPATILQRALKRKQAKNPAYSLRALARDLRLSAPYLSRILKGEKPFPEGRFEAFVRVLEMDEAGARLLTEALLLSAVRARKIASSAAQEILSAPAGRVRRSPVAEYQESTHQRFLVLDDWYSLAILDLVTCADFVTDPAQMHEWIAQRLDIPGERVRRTFAQLVEAGLLVEKDGRWRKNGEKLRFPTQKSHAAIRRHHQLLMKKAMEVMNERTGDADFEQRLITSFTLAANPAHVAEAKRRLQQALFEIAEFLAEGECTEVYQLNAQLFPLTLTRSPKQRG